MRRRIISPASGIVDRAKAARPRVSTTHLGTAYELRVENLLSREPYRMHLVRVGGASDKGIDLRGRWSPKQASNDDNRLFDVVVQCKAERGHVRPAAVREFAHVVAHHESPLPPLGILCSLNGFSREAVETSFESTQPLSLVHYNVERDRLTLIDHDRRRSARLDTGDRDEDERVITWNRNPAWKRIAGN
ncbi:hypothetical protein JCM3766R1_004334 [Sporobolomyces carnicolor]